MIIENFKEGQMIPKRLGMISCHKKVRQYVRFGCDVTVERTGNKYKMYATNPKKNMMHMMIMILPNPVIKMKNGTKRKCSILINNRTFIGDENSILISVLGGNISLDNSEYVPDLELLRITELIYQS